MNAGQARPIPLVAIGLLCFAGAEVAALSSVTLDGDTMPMVWPATGLLLGAPLVLGWWAWRAAAAGQRRSWPELAVTIVVASALAQGIYGNILPDLVRAPTYLLPALLWAVFRLGSGGTAATMLAVVVVGLWNTGQATGPYALLSLSPAFVIIRAQGAALFTSLSLVLLGGMVAERRRVFGELERAATEIRTLWGLIPICAWCHQVRDDEGFWHGIDAYLDSHTEATFSHSICPTCAEQ